MGNETISKLKKELTKKEEDNENRLITELNNNNKLKVELSEINQKFQDECNSRKQDKLSFDMELKRIKDEKLKIEEEKSHLIIKNKKTDDRIVELNSKYDSTILEKNRINEDLELSI